MSYIMSNGRSLIVNTGTLPKLTQKKRIWPRPSQRTRAEVLGVSDA